jgi:hypothetical protein
MLACVAAQLLLPFPSSSSSSSSAEEIFPFSHMHRASFTKPRHNRLQTMGLKTKLMPKFSHNPCLKD